MPELKLVSTHDAGISPRKVAARGRGVSPSCLFPWEADNVSFLLPLRGQVPVTGRP